MKELQNRLHKLNQKAKRLEELSKLIRQEQNHIDNLLWELSLELPEPTEPTELITDFVNYFNYYSENLHRR